VSKLCENHFEKFGKLSKLSAKCFLKEECFTSV